MKPLFVATAAVLLCAAPAPVWAHTVCIMYFDNTSKDAELEPFRKGLADMLITDLVGLKDLRIVERERLNDVLSELKLSQSAFIDPKTAQRLGRGLAAEYVMTGAYVVQKPDKLRIDVKVVRVETAEVVASDHVEGTKADVFELEKELVELLTRSLSLKLETAEKGRLRKSQTESLAAFERYSAGLDARDRGDEAAARQHFQAALDADPSYRSARTSLDRLKAAFEKYEALSVEQLEPAIAKVPLDSAEATAILDVPRSTERSETLRLLLLERLVKAEAPTVRTGLEVVRWATYLRTKRAKAAAPGAVLWALKRWPAERDLLDLVERKTVQWRGAMAIAKRPPWEKMTHDLTDAVTERASALLERLATEHPGATEQSATARYEALRKQSDQARAADFERRLGSLASAPDLGVEAGELFQYTEEAEDRGERLGRELTMLEKLVGSKLRPEAPLKYKPELALGERFFPEAYLLLVVAGRYRCDPQTTPLLPAIGEYLLRKYPEHHERLKFSLGFLIHERCYTPFEQTPNKEVFPHLARARALLQRAAADKSGR